MTEKEVIVQIIDVVNTDWAEEIRIVRNSTKIIPFWNEFDRLKFDKNAFAEASEGV